MASVPPQLGPFELLRRLGAGGMAETFLAVRRGPAGFEQRACIKRILPAYESDQEFVRSFLAEARTSAALRHANIVQVLDFGFSEREASHYLALELVDGMDLRVLITREAQLDPELVTLIASDLAAALEHAHAEDEGRPPVVHRDLSPSNVLISRAGEVKLTDFGIARVIGGSHQTSSGIIKGKIPYMPPEYIEAGSFDARGDLFALGVLLYELCHGRRPFDGDSELDTLRKIAAGERRPFEADAPAALVACVDRLLQKQPDDRFQDARALLEALPSVPVNQVRRRLAAMVRARTSIPSAADGRLSVNVPVGPTVSMPGPPTSIDAGTPTPGSAPALAERRSRRGSGPSRKALVALAGSVLLLLLVVTLAVARQLEAPAIASSRPPRLPAWPATATMPQPATAQAPSAAAPPADDTGDGAEPAPGRGVTGASAAASPAPPSPSHEVDVALHETDGAEAARATSGARTSRTGTLQAMAELYVVVYPFGDVWVDDKPAGQAPLSLRLAPGSHEIAVGEGRVRERQTVRLRAGESRNLTFRSPAPPDR
jgi:eukaryotic-like serine/threonine-protein kinase